MIRHFESSDLERLLDIYNDYVKTTTFTLDLQALTKIEFDQNIRLSKGCLVLEEYGKILGYGYLSSFSSKEGYSISGVITIYLDQYQLTKGYGLKLLHALEKQAKTLKMNQIYAIISHTNLVSLAFFTKHDYELIATFPAVARKFNQSIDVLYFRKVIE